MRGLRAWLLRLRGVFRKHDRDAELAAEMESHLQLHVDDALRRGMTPEQARRDALLKLGGLEQTKENYRDQRGLAWLDGLVQDLRFGARLLRKNPGFTIPAILTLALGIGANTAIFSVVKGVLLDSLPYRQPDRLVALACADSQTPNPTNVSFGTVEDWKARTRTLRQVALFHGWTPASLGKNQQPEMVFGLRVTANFFDTLGVSPALGRGFLTEEDRPSRWHVVLLSDSYWRRHFGANPGVVGATILLDQIPFEIVGVLPRSFDPMLFNDAGSPADVWAPLGYDLSLPKACRTCQHLHAVARLNDGVSIGEAKAELDSVASQLAREFPQDYPPDATVAVLPLRESWYGKTKMALWLLFGATSLVLLISCANVANLFLTQGAKKRREVALRCVLGAARFRIVRQLLTESLILGFFGATAGVLLAFWGTPLLVNWAAPEIARLNNIHFDLGILAFGLGIAAATGILMGLLPALEATRVDHREALQQSSRALKGTSPSRLRSLLVSAQVCLAFVLAVGSGLLLKSFERAWHVDPGVRVQNLLEVNFSLNGPKYVDDNAAARAQSEIVNRVRQIPGVESVGLVSTPPVSGSLGALDTAGFQIQYRHIPDREVPSADRYIVSPGYFEAVGTLLLRGRLFTEADATSANAVAIISESAAREIFPGEDPIGRRIQLGGRHDDRPWAEIVGIVADVHQYGLDSPTTPQAYLLHTQSPFNYAAVLMIHSTIAPNVLTRAVEGQIWGFDRSTLVFNPAPMSEILSHSLAPRRFTMSLLALFGALALLLAAIGTYGVMSHTVVQRTGEIGVRLAFGAQPRDVLRLLSSGGMLRAGAGLLAGLLISLGVTRLLTSELFAVSALDPLTYAATLLLLAGVALVACYVPARRAARVDPMVALRYE